VNAPRASRSVRAAVALFRAVAVLLPAAFRARDGDELMACFTGIAGEARATRGRLAVCGVTLRAILDLAGRAAAERVRSLRGARTGAYIWQGAWLDLRHAARRLARRPAFAVTSVMTLGLGLAAAAAVFSLVHGVVLRPLPYPDSDRIVEIDHAGAGIGASQGGLGITYGFYRFYAEHLRTPQAIAMYSGFEQTLVGAGDPVRLAGIRATPSLIDVLRVPPSVGRWFTAAEGGPGAPLTVVLSDGLWRERFGADPSVVGRAIDLGGVSREVVGVMPAGFAFPSTDTAFWTPRAVPSTGIGGWNERAIARLAPGLDARSLEREIQSLDPALRELGKSAPIILEYLDDARISPMIVPLKERVVGNVRITLWILLGTVGFVLLVAIANVANLFLVRAGESQRELAVRRALGASTGRLIRTAMAESLLIALAAGGLALAATVAAIRGLLLAAPPNVPRLDEVGMTPAVALVAARSDALTGVLLGLMPVLGRGARFDAGGGVSRARTMDDHGPRRPAGPRSAHGGAGRAGTRAAHRIRPARSGRTRCCARWTSGSPSGRRSSSRSDCRRAATRAALRRRRSTIGCWNGWWACRAFRPRGGRALPAAQRQHVLGRGARRRRASRSARAAAARHRRAHRRR
jgi:hypothetical protein